MISRSLTKELAGLHAELCSALADPTRLVLLYALAGGSRNVGELTAELGLPQSTISRHLKVLRDRGLVAANRNRMNVQYVLTDRRIIRALDLLRGVLHGRIEVGASLIEVRPAVGRTRKEAVA